MDNPGLWKLEPAAVNKPWGLVHSGVMSATGIRVGLGELWLASAQTGAGNYSNTVADPAASQLGVNGLNFGSTYYVRVGALNWNSIGNYMVPQPYSFSTPEAEMNAMADLVEAGKIRSVPLMYSSGSVASKPLDATRRASPADSSST